MTLQKLHRCSVCKFLEKNIIAKPSLGWYIACKVRHFGTHIDTKDKWVVKLITHYRIQATGQHQLSCGVNEQVLLQHWASI